MRHNYKEILNDTKTLKNWEEKFVMHHMTQAFSS